MKVLSIYESIQGEMPNLGRPVTIVRFAGCNLTCWYCDAKNDMAQSYTEMTLESICERVHQLGNKEILLTGGEPLLQADLNYLIALLNFERFKVVVETNGTLPLSPVTVPCTVVMDIKLDRDDHTVEVGNLKTLQPNDAIKFVYWDKDSFFAAWYFIHNYVSPDARYQVIFSPIDFTKAFVEDFVFMSKDFPRVDFRMQVQIHKLLGAG